MSRNITAVFILLKTTKPNVQVTGISKDITQQQLDLFGLKPQVRPEKA